MQLKARQYNDVAVCIILIPPSELADVNSGYVFSEIRLLCVFCFHIATDTIFTKFCQYLSECFDNQSALVLYFYFEMVF